MSYPDFIYEEEFLEKFDRVLGGGHTRRELVFLAKLRIDRMVAQERYDREFPILGRKLVAIAATGRPDREFEYKVHGAGKRYLENLERKAKL